VRRELAGAGGSVTLVFPETFRGELPGRFDVVVDLLGFGASGLTDGWWRETERRAEITLLAAQRLAAGEAAPALWIEVTALGGDFGAAAAPEAGFAGVGLGLSRCLAAESEGRVETLYVDFDGGCTEENVARRVVEEAGRNGDDREVGYRAGRRLLVRWVPQDLPRQTPAALARETIVLAVGGARGVTAQICLELAARGAGRFLIAGRTPEPTPSAPRELDFQAARDEVLARARASGERVVPAEVERRAWESVWEEERRRTLDQLRQTGAEVIYVQCDVSDGPAMERLAGLIKLESGVKVTAFRVGGASAYGASPICRWPSPVAGATP
jgi:hypothetical protein